MAQKILGPRETYHSSGGTFDMSLSISGNIYIMTKVWKWLEKSENLILNMSAHLHIITY
jgi:hypothetical protein